MNAFEVGGDGSGGGGGKTLVVLDMPGYGKGGRAEWGTQVLKYLGKRRQLKRAFLLVDAAHGVKDSDRQLLALFKEQAIPYQIVLSKVDRVLFGGKRNPSPKVLEERFAALAEIQREIQVLVKPDAMDEGGGTGEVISCSAEKWIEGKRMGVEQLRFAMLRAAGLHYEPKVKLGKAVEIVSFDDLPTFDMNEKVR